MKDGVVPQHEGKSETEHKPAIATESPKPKPKMDPERLARALQTVTARNQEKKDATAQPTAAEILAMPENQAALQAIKSLAKEVDNLRATEARAKAYLDENKDFAPVHSEIEKRLAVQMKAIEAKMLADFKEEEDKRIIGERMRLQSSPLREKNHDKWMDEMQKLRDLEKQMRYEYEDALSKRRERSGSQIAGYVAKEQGANPDATASKWLRHNHEEGLIDYAVTERSRLQHDPANEKALQGFSQMITKMEKQFQGKEVPAELAQLRELQEKLNRL